MRAARSPVDRRSTLTLMSGLRLGERGEVDAHVVLLERRVGGDLAGARRRSTSDRQRSAARRPIRCDRHVCFDAGVLPLVASSSAVRGGDDITPVCAFTMRMLRLPTTTIARASLEVAQAARRCNSPHRLTAARAHAGATATLHAGRLEARGQRFGGGGFGDQRRRCPASAQTRSNCTRSYFELSSSRSVAVGALASSRA